MTQAKPGSSSAPTIETELPGLNGASAAGLQMWLEAGRTFMTGYAAAQGEVTEFARDRLERWREATGCIASFEAGEVLRIQADYIREMMGAYAALWPRVAGLLVESAPDRGREIGVALEPDAQFRQGGLSDGRARKCSSAA